MRENKKKADFLLLWQFSIDDFKSRYAGSFMGASWAFIQPLMTIVIYWFIFQVGFHSQPVDNFPFILWLVSGLIPWFFIGEGITGVTASLAEYSYLVKKVLFNVDILPAVKIVSCAIVQIFLVGITVVLFCLFGYFPDAYYLQLPYYMAYMILLLVGIGYFLSALYPFFKDLLQIVNIIMQCVFWFTPIVWDFNIMPETVRTVLTFNPFYYIVNGYRNALVYKKFFWEDWKMGIYYWAVLLFFFIVGKVVFTKMKPHFADTL